MTYLSISKCANDAEFMARLIAAVADEGDDQPEILAQQLRWPVCATDDIEAAYLFALSSEHPSPGGDETVITDQMILSAVQANWPQPAPPPP